MDYTTRRFANPLCVAEKGSERIAHSRRAAPRRRDHLPGHQPHRGRRLVVVAHSGCVATTATALAAVVHGITQIVNTFNKSPAQLESAFENGSQVGKRFLAKLEGAGKPCSEVQLYAFIAHDLGAALGGLGTAVLSDVSDMAPQVAEIRMNAVNAQRELAL